MTVHTPLFLQPSGADPDITPTAQEFRRLVRELYKQFPGGNVVTSPGDCLVTQRAAGANFSVDIAAGNMVVVGDDITSQGFYLTWNDAVFNIATPSAPGSGTRHHRVILQIRDKLSNGTYTTYDAQFQVLADTGSGLPAEPNSAITLAQISIAAGQLSVQNGNITDMRQVVDDQWDTVAISNAGGSGNIAYRATRDRRGVKLASRSIDDGTAHTDGTVIATIPATDASGKISYRPSSPFTFPCGTDTWTSTASEAPRLTMGTDGTLTLRGAPAPDHASLSFIVTVPVDL